ncbi:MAG: tRNA threonylcarbamoyladenosine dehydratase [Sterolibacteriaceae bacterium]|nr:tRNA threonylcarbamoyladenosine dehydratase [Candidatus Methylophosphatis haderslevensis]
MSDDFDRRFSALARLYGAAAAARIRAAAVCVIGIGGVGSWSAEALARSGVGRLTLIDLDHIAESNVNRQIHALDPDFGRAKVAAMASRIAAINPACAVDAIEEFVDESNLAQLLARPHDMVIDAIDNVRAKAALAAHCRRARQRLVMCGGAGGRSDPTRVQVDDLARSAGDALLAKVRARLRKDYGFTREAGKKFGIEAVFSAEPVVMPIAAACDSDAGHESARAPQGLNCAGYGSSVCVTAAFGMAAAARALRVIVARAG